VIAGDDRCRLVPHELAPSVPLRPGLRFGAMIRRRLDAEIWILSFFSSPWTRRLTADESDESNEHGESLSDSGGSTQGPKAIRRLDLVRGQTSPWHPSRYSERLEAVAG
jgi:hypothetical protein